MIESGAEIASYSGVDTALRFGPDPTREFRALTQTCGVYDLGWRSKISVTGDDRVRWMNGMVTNNIRDLQRNQGNYNFLLNAKGHILGDLYVYNRGDSLCIDTENAQLASLMQTLDHFIIMDDVELKDISAQLTALAIQGPQAKDVLAKIGISTGSASPMLSSDIDWQGAQITITHMESPAFPTYELWGAPKVIEDVWNALIQHGAVPVGTQALEWFRIMAGIPKYGQDIRESDLPQETGQDHALNFTKGCYIGQEIVERIRSRGAVRRTFTGFIVTSGDASPGVKLSAQEKEVGVLTSVAKVPSQELGEHTLALGYIRRESLDSKVPITFSGGSVQPHALPFAKT